MSSSARQSNSAPFGGFRPAGRVTFPTMGKSPKDRRGRLTSASGQALRLQFASPGPPLYTEEPEGCVGNRVRRGNFLKGVYALSLPFYSIDESGASTRCNAPKWCNIHRGRWSAGGHTGPPLRNPASFSGGVSLGEFHKGGPQAPLCLVVSRGWFLGGGKSKSPLLSASLGTFCANRKYHRTCTALGRSALLLTLPSTPWV